MSSINFNERRLTAWWETAAHFELCAMTLEIIQAWPRSSWRHHGNGLLQRYVRENEHGKELRIHIWHPALLINGMEQSGQIHDHRFDLQSSVLVGAIYHSELELRPSDVGEYRQFTVANARTGTTPEPTLFTSARYNATFHHTLFQAGMTYTFPKRAFHLSKVDALAVTLVTKGKADGYPARILGPAEGDSTMAHGFARQIDDAEKVKYIDEAIVALEEEIAKGGS